MNTPDFVHAVEGYTLSRDYSRLVGLMRKASVVCLVNYGSTGRARDVAHTLWRRLGDGEALEISARGISYVDAVSEAHFIEQCRGENVEFFDRP